MANTTVVSFSATDSNKRFIDTFENKSKKVNEALDFYRKCELAREMRRGKIEEDEEDVYLANAGMEDYLRIIEESENE